MIFNESAEKFVGTMEEVLGGNYKWVTTFENEEEEGICFVSKDNEVIIPLSAIDNNYIKYIKTTYDELIKEPGIHYYNFNAEGYKVAYLSDSGDNLKLKNMKLKISPSDIIDMSTSDIVCHAQVCDDIEIYQNNDKIIEVNKCTSEIMDFVLYKFLDKMPKNVKILFKAYIPSFKAKGIAKCNAPFDFLKY